MKALALTCLVVGLFSLTTCGPKSATDAPPIIEHDRVLFTNGKKVRFEDDKIYLQNNINQPERGKPVTKVERAYSVEEWKRVIVETEHGYYEDIGLVFRFYDYNGQLIRKTPEFFGEYVPLLMKKAERLTLVQISEHFDLSEGYILDPDGNQVGTIAQKPRAFDATICKEGDLFLIKYRRRTAGVRYLTVDVYNTEGKLLATSDFKTGGSYIIEVGERKIPISLPNPS